jgi:phosphatidyl-myo-inositol dimannoside synthase
MSFPAKMRPVIIITHEFYPQQGGIATFTEEMARAAAALGYPVEVWAQRNAREPEKPWPFTVRRIPIEGTHNLRCRLRLAFELIRERRRLRQATVYLSEPGPMLTWMLLLPLSALRIRRLILTFHGSEILRFHADPATRIFARMLIRRAFRISTLTRFTEELLCSRFPQAAPKIIRTPGAIRTDFVPASMPTHRAKDKIIILTVGRIHPRKGQWQTLQALAALPADLRHRIEYRIVGASRGEKPERALRLLAAQSALTITFCGKLSGAPLQAAYREADIFALTSIPHGHSVESFGLVYLEASAHGLPIIAHRIGGVAEAVIDGETGLLVPPHQPVQLTAAFQRLIEDPSLRQRLGQAGHVWAHRTSWTRASALLFAEDHPAPTGSGSPITSITPTPAP